MAERDPELVDLERQLSAWVQRYAERSSELQQEACTAPFVLCWAIAYEFTSTQQEADHTAGRGVITPDAQPVSASSGLGRYLQQSFDA